MFQVFDKGIRVFLKASENIIWIKTVLLFLQRSLGENLNSNLKEEQRLGYAL